MHLIIVRASGVTPECHTALHIESSPYTDTRSNSRYTNPTNPKKESNWKRFILTAFQTPQPPSHQENALTTRSQ